MQHNHHGNNETSPVNYDIFSLNKIISLSTGYYNTANGNNSSSMNENQLQFNIRQSSSHKPPTSVVFSSVDVQQQQYKWEEISNAKFSFSSDSLNNNKVQNGGGVAQDQMSDSSFNFMNQSMPQMAQKARTSSRLQHQQQKPVVGNVDDLFFSNVMKTPNSGQKKNSAMADSPNVSPMRSPLSLSANTSSVKDDVKPVTFKHVINGGHRGLYHVIAILCSNDVIILRFMGVVKSLDNKPESENDRNVASSSEASDKSSISNTDEIDDDPTELIGVTDFDDDAVVNLDSRFRPSNGQHGNADDEDDDNMNVRLCCPVIRSVTFFKDNAINIATISLEQTARWLTCITSDGDVYIIPVCRIFFPYNPDNIWPFIKPPPIVPNLVSLSNPQRHFTSLKDYTIFANDDSKTERIGVNFMNSVKELELVVTSKLINPKISASSSLAKTKRLYNIRKHGKCVCSVWWISFEQRHFIIYGTDKGYIVLLNMQTQTEEGIIQGIKFGIKRMQIVSDTHHKYKYLLVYAQRGNFYKVTLEAEDLDFHSYKSITDYCNNDPLLLTSNDMKDDARMFKPERLERFCQDYPCNVRIQEDPRKGPMLACYSNVNHQLSIFGPESTDRFPLYVYQLNSDSALVHCTDRLLYSVQRPRVDVSRSDPQPDKLWISSRLLSGSNSKIAEDLFSQHTGKSNRTSSVFQEFVLPSDQVILGFLPGFIYRVKKSKKQTNVQSDDDDDDSDDENDNEVYEEEGVFVYTQNSIFELRQRHQPKDIFQHLLINSSEIGRSHTLSADQFGNTFGLNLFDLYEKAADQAYNAGNYSLAFKLYDLSNVSESKLVSKLMQSHRINSVLDYLSATLSSPENLSMVKRTELSDMLFLGFMFKITTETREKSAVNKRTGEDAAYESDSETTSEEGSQIITVKKSYGIIDNEYTDKYQLGHYTHVKAFTTVDEKLWKRFRSFLNSNQDYNASMALTHLIARGFVELSLEVAHQKNLMSKCLQMLVRKGHTKFTNHCMHFLYECNYSELVCSIGNGVLLRCCPPALHIRFLMSYLTLLRKKKLEYGSTQPAHLDSPEEPLYGFSEKVAEERSAFYEEDPLKTVHATIVTQITNLIPYVKEEQVLLQIIEFFDPEQTLSTLKTTHRATTTVITSPRTTNALFSDTLSFLERSTANKNQNKREEQTEQKEISSFDRDYYFPYIHRQQHLEIFILGLLCLVLMKKQKAAILMNSISPTSEQPLEGHKQSFTRNPFYNFTQEKLEETLRNYADYRKQFVLRKCLQYQNKSAVTIIYELSNMWMEALGCKLSQIRDTYSTFITKYQDTSKCNEFIDRIARNVLSIFDKYIIRPFASSSDQVHADESMQSIMILKIFNSWNQMSLPLQLIEDYCLKNLHVIGDYLSYILLQQRSEVTNRPFYLPFSHKFYLKITQTFVNSIKKHNSEENVNNRNLQLQILRNMEKEVQLRNNITTLTSSLMSSRVILFTCSHKYPYKSFYSSILPEFNTRMQHFTLDEKEEKQITQQQQQSETSNTSNTEQSTNRSVESYLIDRLNGGETEYVQKFINTIAKKILLRDYQLPVSISTQPLDQTTGSVAINQACPVCVYNHLCKQNKSQKFWQE